MREASKDFQRLKHISEACEVSPLKLWVTIENDIPVLKPLIDKLIAEENF